MSYSASLLAGAKILVFCGFVDIDANERVLVDASTRSIVSNEKHSYRIGISGGVLLYQAMMMLSARFCCLFK
jgi:hypothetical protein